MGRITAIADIFDALTSERPYKEAWSIDAAMELIREEAGEGLDPRLAGLFLGLRSEVEGIKEKFADN
ncbi:HD-GYP domain-containing protein (c-di-GMP phosphodiesterase class II) [Desulfurispira natronophila]|uniref:HD-GYP domain-containing protein (C-di-GMP phosphodiesterase class II) n=1 Tax=Desulfurispira natronophila TaxID=682562 RepID=A0A7W7Y3S7_9BACT|nr:HD domain-containing phosphohydrolase [Desulfurispira natronophila]MBB5021553.1 HD-GYP domain-containing protein (c-di-GMP phosphodiesterase class II) [Desulfurispira natronophila]